MQIIVFSLLIAITICHTKVESIEWKNGADCTTHLNLLTAFVKEYKRLSNVGASLSCHRELNSILTDFKVTVEANIINVVDEVNTFLDNTQYNIPSQVNIITAIRSGDFLSAHEKLLQNHHLTLQLLIPAAYEDNLKYAGQILKFLNTLPNIEDIILGYRILFDKMIANCDVYNTVTTTIAYQVMNVFNITQTNNENMVHLHNHLPESLKNFPWNSILSIHNLLANEVLFAPVEDIYKFDSERRNSFTYTSECLLTHCQFSFIPSSNGSFFYIKNNRLDEYLYADTNTLAFDIQRRRVFTLMTKTKPSEMGHWSFEAIENSDFFKIKNVFWNEYLYIDEKEEYKFPANKNCRHVLTWRSGSCEQTGCKWKIIPA